MPTHREIYEKHARQYEALISREDYQGNILRAIREIQAVEGLDVLDLGAGTGRLAALLAPIARSVAAFDLSPQMLAVARDKVQGSSASVRLAAADHRRLPLGSSSADVIVSGWSVSYVATWHAEQWEAALADWLEEARRVLRSGGSVILLESLGTGNPEPVRLPHLEDFYDWLDAQGFSMKWIRTDYMFESVEVADKLTGFFFGAEMTSKIRRGDIITLPECTGVWWCRF